MNKRRLFLLAVALASSTAALAQPVAFDEPRRGDGRMEGPPQAATLILRTAENADATAATAEDFLRQGMFQVHGGDYVEAERSFRQALLLRPGHPMGFFGLSLANTYEPGRAVLFLWEAYQHRENASALEGKIIEAYARFLGATSEPKTILLDEETGRRAGIPAPATNESRSRLLLELAHLDPTADVLALRLRERVLSVANGGEADVHDGELLGRLRKLAADHPALRYGAFLTGVSATGPALTSLKASSELGRLWSTAARLEANDGRIDDAAQSDAAALRVHHRTLARHGGLPFEAAAYTSTALHRIEGLITAGRYREALAAARELIALPRHPTLGEDGSARAMALFMEATLASESWESVLTEELTKLAPQLSDPPSEELLFAEGRALIMTGKLEEARLRLDRLAARGPDATRSAQLLTALLDIAEGNTEAFAVLDRLHYDREHAALLRLAAGDKEVAVTLVRTTEATGGSESYDSPGSPSARTLAVRAWVESSAGDPARADAALARLRDRYAFLDPTAPVFSRLTSRFEQALSSKPEGGDGSPPVPHDERVSLDLLGPKQWTPETAPPFVLPVGKGTEGSLAAYGGRPVVLVFYLGAGCLHCVQQLEALSPRAADFQRAGMEIVTIGTDTVADVQSTVQASQENDTDLWPFTILCDPKHEVFKRYRCFDDFDNQPVHGTFLIDADGKILWRDISIQPFMDVDFLLREFPRLLAQAPRGR